MTAEPSAAFAESGDSEHSYLQQLGARVPLVGVGRVVGLQPGREDRLGVRS